MIGMKRKWARMRSLLIDQQVLGWRMIASAPTHYAARSLTSAAASRSTWKCRGSETLAKAITSSSETVTGPYSKTWPSKMACCAMLIFIFSIDGITFALKRQVCLSKLRLSHQAQKWFEKASSISLHAIPCSAEFAEPWGTVCNWQSSRISGFYARPARRFITRNKKRWEISKIRPRCSLGQRQLGLQWHPCEKCLFIFSLQSIA